ncbi:TonB-dependent copper receptor [Achromobacter xylosoxidans]|uniref:TonB-dependent copper receptor n=1 Tax=Alcaligenes xylosoxydans xylosoxydans TaxID=85698 RepID=UPI001232B4F3|nr:TonB-dependent copper receptor [Achromobacter xylosoxidans]KAA5925083.1 TonB-dependent copper receptor [Achromobacter xylosoxidans]
MRKKKEILRASCLATALAAALPAWSNTVDSDGITMTDPVVITGVAPSAPLTVTTDPKIPRQPLPASDGTDYLKTIPGFSAVRNGGTNGDPVLRGMFGSRLNILTDGTSMPGACPARMDAPSSYISPENFDKLTVIKGPQTVLWGPGASAGTIKFDRDSPHFTEPGVRFDGSLQGGSNGRNDQAADLTVGNDKVYTRFTANHSHSQDYKDGDGNTVPSRWDKWNADVTLGFTPDPDTVYELTAGTGDGQARYAGRGMDGSQFKRESFGLRAEKRNLGGMLDKLEAQLYYNYADHVMDNYTLRKPDPHGMMPMAMASNVDRATWGGRIAGTWNLAPDLSLVTGLDFQQSRHRSRKGSAKVSYRANSWIKDASFANTGVFGELTWHAADDSRVIGGARVDWASAKDFRRETGSRMMLRPNPTAGERRNDTLPSGFLRYERDLAALPATVYIGLGHAERFPDYWELFSPTKGPDGSVNAFRGVKPEKTTQLDLGAQYKTDTLDAWVSGYAGYVDDFILFDYGKGGMGGMGATAQARNVDARIAGGELGVSYQVAPRWKLGGTLAYAWGQNRSDGRPMPQMPPLEARLSAAYDDGTWSAGALWRVVAAQRRYALEQGNVVSKDFGPSAGFGVFSLNGGYAFSKQVQLSLGVDNLFDKTYAEHLNLAGDAGFGFAANTAFNEPGRTFWARLSFKY